MVKGITGNQHKALFFVFVLSVSMVSYVGIIAAKPSGDNLSKPFDNDGSGNIHSNTIDQKNNITNQTINVIVIFENSTVRNAEILRQQGAVDIGGEEVDLLPVLFAEIPQESIDDVNDLPFIDEIVIDQRERIDHAPLPVLNTSNEVETQSNLGSQTVPWGIYTINARSAAKTIPNANERNITVAVLDTGINSSNQDLDGNVVWGANFSNGVERYGVDTADDNNGHGTSVASLLAAENDSRGVVGVAPNVQLYSIKILDKNNFGFYSWWIRGLDAAVKGPDRTLGTDDDADIISMSLGGESYSRSLEDAIEEANTHAVLVASAMNEGDGNPDTNEVYYPAKFPEVIAVAATDRSNTTTRWSSEGAEVEVAAPGNDLTVSSRLTKFSGTSAAAPLVSGTLALMMAADLSDGAQDYDKKELRDVLQQTAIDIESPGVDRKSGYGLIQTESAVENITGTSTDSDLARFDIDSSGAISFSEYLEALSAHNNGDRIGGEPVSFDDMLGVIRAFNRDSLNGTSVTSASPSLSVVAPDSVEPGETFEATYELVNIGQDDALAAGLELSMSPGAHLADHDGNGTAAIKQGNVFLTGGLAAGQSMTITLILRVDSNTTTSTLDLTGKATVVNSTDAVTTSVIVTSGPEDGNEAPTAAYGLQPSTPEVEQIVTFDASASSDPDGNITSYEWDFDGNEATDVTGETVTHTFAEAGTYNVTLIVTDESGGTDSLSQSITVSSGTPRVVIEPASRTARPTGQAVSYDIVLRNANGGVGAYSNITVSLNDTNVATLNSISTDVSGSANSGIYAGGASAYVNVPFGGDTNDTGDVTLAMVTITANQSGVASINVTLTGDISKEDGNLYDISAAEGGTLTVSASAGPPAVVGEDPPSNTDADSQYEDVNGNERLDIGDVQALFANRDTNAVQNNVVAFDFNDNERIDIGDVQALLVEFQNS